ncbi:hypothetical protein DV515_00005589 [Chloebia gouldiae]|uniref:Phorbol-ester/DAG-type domain-containing protein n=1 Tax=Chloebia gouldiae TaxID=44316 RepID=A0A3L8SMZ3_CHLGU|nr:hypothetical protein DV515_00005589 [Chloebia gouldiae]
MSADPSPSPIPGPPRGLGWGWGECIPPQDPLEAGGGMRVTWVAGVPRSAEEMDPKCPQDLEAPPAHTFKMTSFKKVKACGICRQAITRQGSTCRGCKLSCHTKCQAKVRPVP